MVKVRPVDELRGFVLAAGLGTRLRPVTDYLPKPLLPVAGTSLLDRGADQLLAAGCSRVVVNAHHRADRIAEHLRQRTDAHRFHLSLESELLGTAGAFHGAREFLAGARRFLVFNGDVLCQAPLREVVAAHGRSGALATLVLVDHPAVNTVRLGGDGVIRDLAGALAAAPRADDTDLTFTGIACYEREVLDSVPAGASDLVSLLAGIMRRHPDAVRGFRFQGEWDDLGTLPRYLAAHRRLLGPGFVSVADGGVVPNPSALEECVVLPGARVPAGVRRRRAVMGPGWSVSIDPTEDPALTVAALAGFRTGTALEWFSGHGSERRFARLREGERRAVLMISPPGDPDHDRCLAINSFLYDLGLGAPAVLAQDQRTRSVLFEDLGDQTLERLVAGRPEQAADLYDRVLDRLADLQTFGAESRHRCPSAHDRSFDHEHLRWETDYFRQRFLGEHCGTESATLEALEPELEALALAALEQPCTLVHRDFQSQNILIKDGMVRLVDVQGMRWGPVAYDVASVLFDPYVGLEDGLRARLLDEFPRRLADRGGLVLDADRWRSMVMTAALQRLMQALAAYAFLGRVKGKTGFLRHIPKAMASLRSLTAATLDAVPRPCAPPAMPVLNQHLASLKSGDGEKNFKISKDN